MIDDFDPQSLSASKRTYLIFTQARTSTYIKFVPISFLQYPSAPFSFDPIKESYQYFLNRVLHSGVIDVHSFFLYF